MVGSGDPTSAILQQQFFDPRDAPLTRAERKGARFRQVQTLRGTTALYDPRGNALRGWARAGHSLGLLRRPHAPGGVLPPTHPFAKTYTGTPHRVKNLRHLGQPLSQVKTTEKETQTVPPPVTTPGRTAPPPAGPTHHIDKPGFDWKGHAVSAASDLLGPVVKEKVGKIGGNLIDAILRPDPVVPSELQMTDMGDLVDGGSDQTAPITWWNTGGSGNNVGSSLYPSLPPESSPAVSYPSVPHHVPPNPLAGESHHPLPTPPPESHSVGTQAEPGAGGVDAGTSMVPTHSTSAHTQTESHFGPHELDLIFAHPHAFERMIAGIELREHEAQQLRAHLQAQYDAEHRALYTHARTAIRHAFALAGIDPNQMPDTLTNEQAIAIIADAVPEMAAELIELRQRAHTARLHEIHVNDAGTQTVSRPNPLLNHLRPNPTRRRLLDEIQEDDDPPPPPGRRARNDQRRVLPPPRIRTTDLPSRFNYRDLERNGNAVYHTLSAAQRALRPAQRTLLADNAALLVPGLHPRASSSINGAWVYPNPVPGRRRQTRPLEHIDDV